MLCCKGIKTGKGEICMPGLEVAGRRFRTEADYRAALRDQAKIEKIRAQVDMRQPGEVITLYGEMQAGKYRFETVVGNDFDDEIYELAQQFRKQGYDKDSRLSTGRKKARGDKKKTAKAAEKTSGREKQEVSLKDYDKNMQTVILDELKKREKRRT